VPLAPKVESQHKFLWINIAVAAEVFKDRNLKYVFRPQVSTSAYGQVSLDFLATAAKSKLGMEPSKIKVAIIHEDGPYGAGMAESNLVGAKHYNMAVVHQEGYSLSAPDLSSMVIKLKRARPDVILHTGYNPDITLFLRQAKELGLHWKALIGHGAGYGQIDKLYDAFGKDVDYLFNVDPVAAQLLDPKTLKPRPTPRWASTTPGSSSTRWCPGPSPSTAAGTRNRCARPRWTWTSRWAARSRATG
jgi:branched-chain amino acid transport system substrate-binding protein